MSTMARLSSEKSCKQLWKCAVEHHAFFRYLGLGFFITITLILIILIIIILIPIVIIIIFIIITLHRLRSPGRTTRVKQSFFRMGSRFRYRSPSP